MMSLQGHRTTQGFGRRHRIVVIDLIELDFCKFLPRFVCSKFRRRKNNSISIRPTWRFHIRSTLGHSGKFSKQAALWRWLLELTVNACASWCDSTGSKWKKYDRILMQNWNVILLHYYHIWYLFLDRVAPTERFLCGWLLGPYARANLSIWFWSHSQSNTCGPL